MADTDVADMKGTDRRDMPGQGEKPLADANADTENPGGEDQALAKGGSEEE